MKKKLWMKNVNACCGKANGKWNIKYLICISFWLQMKSSFTVFVVEFETMKIYIYLDNIQTTVCV